MGTLYDSEIDVDNIDIHGKLSHLDALDLSELSLASRYALITLSGPWISDDYGRFTTSAGAYPRLPALTDREALAAVSSLLKKELMRTWTIGGTTCWEVAGAYAFKPNLKRAMKERRQIAIRKRRENTLRRERKKAAKMGLPFANEDDGQGAEGGSVITLLRTQRGNLVPNRKGLWYRSTVPVPKGRNRDKVLVQQPDETTGCKLHMLPSFNPYDGLSALGTVLRYYLLLDSDDYGRVRVDLPQLYRQLGPAITKRISRTEIEAELGRMRDSGHLTIVRKTSGKFAFIRDSAQHLKKKKRYDRNIPKLREDREFTSDSEAYKGFFKACEDSKENRDTVQVGQFCERGNVKEVREYADVAAKRFKSKHEEMLKVEPYSLMTPAQFCGLEDWKGAPQRFDRDLQFWHAITSKLPPEQIEQLYFEYKDEFDGTGSARPDSHRMFKQLLKMTPQAYVEQLKMPKN